MTTIATNFVDNIGMFVNAAYLNGVGAQINTNTAAQPLYGHWSAIPAASASNAGALYYCDDCDAVYRSDGSVWTKIRVGGQAGPPMADPPTTGWSSINLGTNTAGADKDSQIITAASGAGVSLNLRVRTLTPAINYSAVLNLEANYPPAATTAFISAAAVLRDSVSGKFLLLGAGDYSSTTGAMILRAASWSSATGTQTPLADLAIGVLAPPKWLRFRDDGTNRHYEYSYNGMDWSELWAEARTTFITADQIGFAVWNSATSQTLVARLRSLTIS
jgi:hypothetical protein